MKFMFASDIHGDADCLEVLMKRYEAEAPDCMFVLGDVLYHGPRNNIPDGYEPKRVAEIINGTDGKILFVRGNCDSEVDQMLIERPILAPFSTAFADGNSFFLTHGHLYDETQANGFDVFVQGHTHIYDIIRKDGHIYLNTGSVSLPKNNNVKSYALYEDGCLYVKAMDGGILKELKI